MVMPYLIGVLIFILRIWLWEKRHVTARKKMYELMSEFKEVYVMELPNTQSEGGLRFWREEIIRFKEFLEEYFQVVITENDIRRAIVSQNKRREALKRFYGLMKLEPVPMSGLELGKVLYGSKYQFGQEEMTKGVK